MSVETAYSYLEAPARNVILLDPEERIAWFQSQQDWIPYAAAQDALRLVEEAINRPRAPRMKGYLIVAESNNGKSRLARECVKRYPKIDDPEAESVVLRTLLIELPPNPDEGAIYDRVLDQLCQPYRPKDPVSIKRRQVVNALQRCGLRALLVDELQRVLSANQNRRRQVLEALRNIAGEVPLPLIVFSTPRGANALASSDEMINRLHPVELPVWQLNDDFRMLLSNFLGLLPLREKSLITGKTLGPLIHYRTEGLIGEVRDLLDVALQHALRNGKEQIDQVVLDSVVWARPSERKRLIKRYGTKVA
ncbi:TniB family NTP-binding protein [Thermomonas fusca]